MSRARFCQNHFAFGSSVSAIVVQPPFSHCTKLRLLLSPPSDNPSIRPHDFGHTCTGLSGSASLLCLKLWQNSLLSLVGTIPPSSWLAMSANVSVGYTPQTTDIFVCRRHARNVVPTRRQHSVMSANFFGCRRHVGETYCQHTLLHGRRNQY